MTAQIGDSILYAGNHYNLVGISPENPLEELFAPDQFGIRTYPCSTACWRGYVATFGLRENRLVLEELCINVSDPEWEEEHKRLTELKEIRRYLPPHRRVPKPQCKPMKPGPCGPGIHGVRPVPPANPHAVFAFSNNYHNVGLPLPFTGGLLLGQDFIQKLYEHMGFHPAWKFEKVIELIFADGVLTAAHDRSEEMRLIRDANSGASGQTKSPDPLVDIFGWIENCFDRRY